MPCSRDESAEYASSDFFEQAVLITGENPDQTLFDSRASAPHRRFNLYCPDSAGDEQPLRLCLVEVDAQRVQRIEDAELARPK
jgi:hypothetical protein